MQRLEVSGAVWPIYGSLGVERLIDKRTFSEGWLQNFKEPAAEGDIQMEYSSN